MSTSINTTASVTGTTGQVVFYPVTTINYPSYATDTITFNHIGINRYLIDVSDEESINRVIDIISCLEPKNCLDALMIGYVKRHKKNIKEILIRLSEIMKKHQQFFI